MLSTIYSAPRVRLLLEEGFQAESKTITKPMQILRTGKFYDERYGSFSITEKMFDEMINNFDTGVRGIVPALDYKHDADDIAAGWFKKLYKKALGEEVQLWADVELTPKCQKVLADKEFGYLSADFDTQYEDNETRKKFGCVLLGAGLTNRPVIKKMSPAIQLSELKQGETMDPKEKELADKAAADKKLADDTQLAAYKKLSDEMGAADPEALMKMIADLKAKVASTEGKKEEEKPAEDSAALGEVKKELAEMKSKLQLAEKEGSFNKMLAEGKVCAAQRESFIKGDMAKFAESAQPIKMKEQGSGAGGKDPVEKDAEDEVLELAEKKAKEGKISMGSAISRVLSENPKLAEKYNQKFKGA